MSQNNQPAAQSQQTTLSGMQIINTNSAFFLSPPNRVSVTISIKQEEGTAQTQIPLINKPDKSLHGSDPALRGRKLHTHAESKCIIVGMFLDNKDTLSPSAAAAAEHSLTTFQGHRQHGRA